jgi:hypothetical protein
LNIHEEETRVLDAECVICREMHERAKMTVDQIQGGNVCPECREKVKETVRKRLDGRG